MISAQLAILISNRVPVFIDGGIHRGTDAFKALALGAKAVGIGRPYLWGLGQAGVDRVIEILQGELKLAMGNCGTQTVSDINREYVATPSWKIYRDLIVFGPCRAMRGSAATRRIEASFSHSGSESSLAKVFRATFPCFLGDSEHSADANPQLARNLFPAETLCAQRGNP